MMEENKIHIKNVVCQRCIMSVESILKKLEIAFDEVRLGEAELKEPLTHEQRQFLETEFSKVGFKLLETREQQMVNHIKSIIIEEVYSNATSNKKLSEIISAQINYDYSHITHLFSEMEKQSIQKFHTAIKIERAKELMEYDEYTIAMIADLLGYSTPAYLSTSFKKATGYSPSAYKKLPKKSRNNLDSV